MRNRSRGRPNVVHCLIALCEADHHVRLAQGVTEPVALTQVEADITTVDAIASKHQETIHRNWKDQAVASTLLTLDGEGRRIELHAFLKVASGHHRHARVRRAIAIQNFDAQKLHVVVWVRLIVPTLVACVGSSVPLPPGMEAGHALAHFRVDYRVDRHAVKLEASDINVPAVWESSMVSINTHRNYIGLCSVSGPCTLPH